MPLPLILGIAAGVAIAGGAGSGIYGGVKLKQANDKIKDAKSRAEAEEKAYKDQETKTYTTMDSLGKQELNILASFKQFSAVFEKIHNRPQFAEYTHENVSLPTYNSEKLKEAHIGANILLGGLSGAALGTAGGFAAAGATTAAVTALGTASTGTAISSLSGVAATNAVLAALGGGAVAAGGGGMALGTIMLGTISAGIGVLLGGAIFAGIGVHTAKEAEKIQQEADRAIKNFQKVCGYLVELRDAASKFQKSLTSVERIYRTYLDELTRIVTLYGKTDWNDFSDKEQLITENCCLLVGLLFKMCQVKLVLRTEGKDSLNRVNKSDIQKSIDEADSFLKDRGLV